MPSRLLLPHIALGRAAKFRGGAISRKFSRVAHDLKQDFRQVPAVGRPSAKPGRSLTGR